MQYFLDDFWNFEHFVNIWTRRPPNYYQNASNNTRNIWKHPGIYYLCEYGIHFVFFWMSCSHCFYWNYEHLSFHKIFLWRWGSTDDTLSIKKYLPKLGYGFYIYQKTWNRSLVTFLFSGKEIPKLFYFQGRESSNIK